MTATAPPGRTRTWLGLERLDPADLGRLSTVADAACAGIEGRGGTVLAVAFAPVGGLSIGLAVLIAVTYTLPPPVVPARTAQPAA
jgi:hypothetical protein